MNTLTRTLFTVGAACTLLVAPTRATAQDTGIAVGTVAPSARVETLDGKAVELGDYYRAGPVVLEFWATWCPLCRRLEPALQAARAKYQGTVRFVGVGVPSNQSAERQKDYVAQKGLTGDFVFDRDGLAMKAFSVPHTSYVVVLDKGGRVVYTGVGDKQDIDAAIRKALP